MIQVNNFETRVTRWEKISISMVLIELELINPQEIIFQSGQYIAITLPENKGLRSYSISSSHLNTKKIELTINILDESLGGAGVHYLGNLKVGDTVMIKGPFGQLNLDETNIVVEQNLNPFVKEILWIGTGSGIAPIKSMLEFLNYLSAHPANDLNMADIVNRLYIGARYDGDVCYFNEFKEVQKENSNFYFKYCLSQIESPENKGENILTDEYRFKGYVTDQILSDIYTSDHKAQTHVFACGKTATIRNILDKLKSDAGIPQENFHIENYG